ncbi:MAG: hypothetical protein MJE63_24910 [Proteobacteria bacterium]|nr:hypothetical protein [Pseudomonadota bacterium]
MAVLEPSLKKQVDELMDKSNQEYDKQDFPKSIEYLADAWDILPKPKGSWDDSFYIALYLSETYLLMEDYKKAEDWAETIFDCALNRIDSGEREFLLGKVAFESGKETEAKNYFKIADQKSESRCFEDQDKKYHQFFKSN